MKICFLASGNGGNLKFIYLANKMGFFKNLELYVVADRDCGSISFASIRNIQNKIIKYTKNNNKELLSELENINPDIIVTNWHKIIDAEVVDKYQGKMINLHYSLLPAFNGLIGIEPIKQAYEQNCQFLGATCHYVNDNVDTGKIISQYSIKNSNNLEIDIQKIFEGGCLILLNSIINILIKDNKLDNIFDNYKKENYSPNLKFDDNIFNNIFWKQLSSLGATALFKDTINIDFLNTIYKCIEFRDNSTYKEIDFSDIYSTVEILEQGRKEKNLCCKEYNEIKIKNKIEELRKIYALYYYGGSFNDGSISNSTSYNDFVEDFKDVSNNQLISKICGMNKSTFIYSINKAIDNFEEHEIKVVEQKELFNKRIRSYIKKDKSFLNKKYENNNKSTNETFRMIRDSIGSNEITDIKKAKDILEKIIKATNNHLIVDFLGNENFDNLEKVECDDEVLKLYWKYSRGINKFPLPPHNIRVDIVFEKLEFIEYNSNIGIILKGFYRDKKWVKQYYCNNEKIKKLYGTIGEYKNSHFYYEIKFDKKQNSGLENFKVTLLPWRFYNILISPREDLISIDNTSKILIIKNIMDIEIDINNTYNLFKKYNILSEYDIKMFGNRFRKLLERLLKFFLLAEQTMFKENYEKDVLGSILEQLKLYITSNDYLYFKENNQKELAEKVIFITEKELIDKLNYCSHDNVKEVIDKSIIDNIHTNMGKIINLLKAYYK